MKTEKQLRKRLEELEMLLILTEKFKVYVSIANRNQIKGQINNIKFLLDEEEDLRGENIKWK